MRRSRSPGSVSSTSSSSVSESNGHGQRRLVHAWAARVESKGRMRRTGGDLLIEVKSRQNPPSNSRHTVTHAVANIPAGSSDMVVA